MTAASRLLPVLFLIPLAAATPEISRPVRTWEFLDATGPKASILGREDGTLEAYVYPLKIFKDLRLRFRLNGRVIPAESVARRIVSRPGSYTILYSGDEYEVRETLAVSPDRSGAVIRLVVDAHTPLRIDVEFVRDFQLMWPASIGTSYDEWQPQLKAFVFGADGQKMAAVLGSPDAALLEREYLTNYSVDNSNGFTLGTINGHGLRTLALAGSMTSRDDALAEFQALAANASAVIEASEKHHRDYLARTVQLELPDRELQQAYEWAKLSEYKGMVDNPLLGRGLVAGYGPSKGVYRPGFAWFFGRDTFWTSFALTSAGDLASARTAIEFIAKYQREDGKIPHEISQSASLVPWFQQFPYGYASADATPLYIIAVENYYTASHDREFVIQQWPRLEKAMAFMRANFDANGFPKNFGVGHGWIEGGPLLPVQVEFYQAGCYVAALRSLAVLAGATAHSNEASSYRDEFTKKKQLLEDRFWLPTGGYAWALGTSGKPIDEPSVLTTVPMWFNVLDQDHALAMIEKLSGEEHSPDWGMRIISSQSPTFSPEGYHYGSVWPLFTGWASVGEYRYHAAAQGYANLRANAWLALDGAGGNPTEVLSGMSYSPLSTASPHQIWSAAMIVSPLLRGLCGLTIDTINGVRLAPHLPANWPGIAIRGVPLNGSSVDFELRRAEDALRLRIVNRGAAFRLYFSPAYSPADSFWRGTFDGQAVQGVVLRTATDQHPEFDLQVPAGEHTLIVPHHDLFGYAVPYDPPQLGARSENLKVISEHWEHNSAFKLTLSGRASQTYRVLLTGAKRVSALEGAKLDGDTLIVEMPAGEGYVKKTVSMSVRPL